MPAETETPAETPLDYSSSAELFAVQRLGRKQSLYYQRFDTAAEAIKFAVEEMPATSSNLVLETEFNRVDAKGIAGLYAAEGFPLERRSAVVAPTPTVATR